MRCLALALFFGATGCCKDLDKPNAVYLGAYNEGFVYAPFAGDTTPTMSIASHQESMFCFKDHLYDSRQHPELFTYSSSAPDVISVDASGTLVGKSVGQASITVTTAGVSSTFPMRVGTAVSRFALTMTPVAPKVGDTVVFNIDPIGRAGVPVTGVIYESIVHPPDLRNIGLDQLLGGGDRSHPRLVPKSTGIYRFITTALHGTKTSGFASVSDTLNFTVAAAIPP